SKFIFDKTFVWIFHILWKVTEKCKTRIRSWQLCTEFNLYIFCFVSWWRVVLNDRKHHLVQFAGFYFFASVVINLNCRFYGFENTLLRKRRNKNNWHIHKRIALLTNVFFVILYGTGFLIFY